MVGVAQGSSQGGARVTAGCNAQASLTCPGLSAGVFVVVTSGGLRLSASPVSESYATTCANPSLVPPSSAIPTAADKQQYDDDDDQKGCVVHVVLLRGSVATTGPV